jgi:hypothetical protein
MMQLLAAQLGMKALVPNPYYMLPRAELDKIPDGYNDLATANGEIAVSADERRSRDAHYFHPQGGIAQAAFGNF